MFPILKESLQEAFVKTLERPKTGKHIPGDAYWLGTNLHRLRKKRGLTQEKLAASAGITARRLRDIEDADADSNVMLATVSALAKALEVDVADLFKHRREASAVEV